MIKTTLSLTTLATVLALGLNVMPAQALFTRTFVSAASGNDANDCDRLTPCRTFSGAHAKTNAGGEIVVLDPGGYGTLTITKSISIVNEGVGEASMFVSGGQAGITINAGTSDVVNLRGLTIYGVGANSGNGIVFYSGKALNVENCVIRNLTGSSPLGVGIAFQPSSSSNLTVSNTIATDNTNAILVLPVGAAINVKAVLQRVEMLNSATSGLLVVGGASTGAINITVADSVAANNTSVGFSAGSAPGQSATSLMLIRSLAVNNALGLQAADATLRVGHSTVTGNGIGWQVSGAAILRSYGDNNIDGNPNGNAPPITTPMK